MSKVITFSRQFPSYHPKVGQPTYFVEKVWESIYLSGDNPIWLGEHYTAITDKIPGLKNIGLHKIYDPKHHTIRAGHRFKAGDWFTPKVLGNNINPKSGRSGPYHSKQIQFAPDIQVKKVWDFEIGMAALYINNKRYNDPVTAAVIADNDGLELNDFLKWFQYPKPFIGQIICWNENIEY